MSHLGQDPKYDYIELPYLEDWEPMPEREWALAFIDPQGKEDYLGFLREFGQRYPFMRGMGAIEAMVPASVDAYVRYSSQGRRMDIDWDLASVPLTDEEREMIDRAKEQRKRKRRMDALKKAGKQSVSAKDLEKAYAAREERAEARRSSQEEVPPIIRDHTIG